MVDLVLHEGGGEILTLELDMVTVDVESCHANGERAPDLHGHCVEAQAALDERRELLGTPADVRVDDYVGRVVATEPEREEAPQPPDLGGSQTSAVAPLQGATQSRSSSVQ